MTDKNIENISNALIKQSHNIKDLGLYFLNPLVADIKQEDGLKTIIRALKSRPNSLTKFTLVYKLKNITLKQFNSLAKALSTKHKDLSHLKLEFYNKFQIDCR